jgi:hypothetical protein
VIALWRELAPEHRRWIYVNALLITAAINLLLNAGIAWLSAIGERRIPLWSIPLVDGPSTIPDTVGTLFLLPLITTIICTTAVWRDVAAGRIQPLMTEFGVALAAQVPPTRLRRALVLGALCMVALAPPLIGLLAAVDFSNLTVTEFVVYKAGFCVVLGAFVTPVIAVLAMATPPGRDEPR